jgi:hypothetical protein
LYLTYPTTTRAGPDARCVVPCQVGRMQCVHARELHRATLQLLLGGLACLHARIVAVEMQVAQRWQRPVAEGGADRGAPLVSNPAAP